MRVLIAEDDLHIRKGLAKIMEGEGYSTILAANGNEALDLFRLEKPDFVCLDVMMPGRSGYDVCRAIRSEDPQIPIIFISAKSEEIDRVVGLELGADDYILKPFGVREVLARIRAVTRRTLIRTPSAVVPFMMCDLTVYPDELRAERNTASIELSLREIAILNLLFERRGKVVDRDLLLDRAWEQRYLPNSRTLDQTISNLRKKIGADPKNPLLIETVHGAGYRYREEK